MSVELFVLPFDAAEVVSLLDFDGNVIRAQAIEQAPEDVLIDLGEFDTRNRPA